MPELGQEYRSQTFILQNARTWTRVQTSDIHSAECHNLDKSTDRRHSFCRMPQLGQEYRSQTLILRAVDELKARTQHTYCRKTPTFLCLGSIRLSGTGFTLLQLADGSLAKKKRKKSRKRQRRWRVTDFKREERESNFVYTLLPLYPFGPLKVR